MQRYFVSPDQFDGEYVKMTGDDVHHLLRVMRAKVDDEVIVSDGIRREARVRLTVIERHEVFAVVVEELLMDHEPDVTIWVAQALPKGDKLETVLQKGTELGVAHFVPFMSERTIVQLDKGKEVKRHERWCKIVKEAAEQSHRSRLPQVHFLTNWKQLLALADEMHVAWICYEQEQQNDWRSQLATLFHAEGKRERLQSGKSLQVMLIIGPEGGFTEQEIAHAVSAGCRSISLGKRILRTETAALVGVSCILYEAGEMGGGA